MKCRELYSAETIAQHVARLGKEISRQYAGEQLHVVLLLNGAVIFGADLVRALDPELDVVLDTVAAASYTGSESSGEIQFRTELKNDPAGKHILIVDDILDTGCTMNRLMRFFREKGAASVRSCVLLDKILDDPAKKLCQCDWVGFRIPNLFVVGYGLDYNEWGRHFPFIGCMEEE